MLHLHLCIWSILRAVRSQYYNLRYMCHAILEIFYWLNSIATIHREWGLSRVPISTVGMWDFSLLYEYEQNACFYGWFKFQTYAFRDGTLPFDFCFYSFTYLFFCFSLLFFFPFYNMFFMLLDSQYRFKKVVLKKYFSRNGTDQNLNRFNISDFVLFEK